MIVYYLHIDIDIGKYTFLESKVIEKLYINTFLIILWSKNILFYQEVSYATLCQHSKYFLRFLDNSLSCNTQSTPLKPSWEDSSDNALSFDWQGYKYR